MSLAARALHSARRLSVAFGIASLLGACAALRPGNPEAPPPPPPPQVLLTVDAPAAQRRLLEANLDLARLAIVAPGEAISDTELRRLEAAAPAQVRALLATQGYMDPEVTLSREPSEPGEVPRVRVQVEPGVQSQVVQADVQVEGALAEAAAAGDAAARSTVQAWREAWTMPTGTFFNDTLWRAAKATALARLRGAGYADANWSGTSAQIDADQATVRMVVVADSGPLDRIGELVVEGLQRHDERSVRNLANFETGAPATEALLLDFQERLQRANLFDRVSVTLAPEPETAAAATVTVRVGELPLQQATAGIGISANNGLRLSVEHLHRRAFGQRATMRNKAEIGRVRQAWEGELSSHTLPGLYRNLLGGAAERLESDTDRVTSLRFRVGRAYDGQRIDRLAFAEIERSQVKPLVATSVATGASSNTTSVTLNHHGTWRDVDSMVLPTLGRSLALQTAVGRVNSSGNALEGGAFARLQARLQVWRPLGGNWYGQARLELGQVYSGGAVNVPDSQRFRAGGDDSVRGYAYRTLTPQVGGVDVGGRVVATGSLEVARPISDRLPSVWWAAFIDGGRAAASWSEWTPAWGAGLGVRWRSPVGPLRVDLAYGEEVKQIRLHLSVGIAF